MTNLISSNTFYFFLFLLILFIQGCKQTPSDENPADKGFKPKGDLSDLVYNPVRPDGSIDSSFLPIILFDELLFDFGTINEGDIVEKKFTFTNVGTAPLLIVKATSTCGCAVPEWPKEPVPPDSMAFILVKFNSLDKPGAQSKEVSIFANTIPNQNTLTIKGMVEKSN